MHDKELYSLNGGTFTKLSTFINLTKHTIPSKTMQFTNSSLASEYTSKPVKYSLSVVGDRILVNYQSRTYVYFTNYGIWSAWSDFAELFSRLVEYEPNNYVMLWDSFGWYTSGVTMFWRFVDSYDADIAGSDPRTIDCYLRTKTLTYGLISKYKRLLMTKIEGQGAASRISRAKITCLVPSAKQSWGSMSGTTWGTSRTAMWNSPKVPNQVVYKDYINPATPLVGAGYYEPNTEYSLPLRTNLRFKRLFIDVFLTLRGGTADSNFASTYLYSSTPDAINKIILTVATKADTNATDAVPSASS
jgi:hypothetical protein